MKTGRQSTGAAPVCATPTNKDHPPESVLELPERTLVYLKSFARGFGREEQGCGLRPIETNHLPAAKLGQYRGQRAMISEEGAHG